MGDLTDLPPLDLAAGATQWQLRPGVLTAVTLAAFACAAAVLPARRSGGWPAWRTLSFAAGLGVVVSDLQRD